ncbi:MAG TPA: hypothetical protein VG293_02575 [Solirubrobacteraceae bacterium]|nr:hypothetical protein [Solirubrobacteraceae bacterium]
MAVLAVIVAVVLYVVLSSAARPIGYDVSYPQCPGSYPSNVLFAVVGVNGGLAHNANPCLGAELSWARSAAGQKRPRQPPLSLYIDTGNPGAHVSAWPRGGATPDYGRCNGLLTNACSYLYGAQRAAYSYRLAAAQDPAAARTAPWWLDVETELSWAGTYQLNVAALRGYVAGLHAAGAGGAIGIYSTSAQWDEITGLTAQTTAAAFGAQLPDWVAGTAGRLALARQNCVSGGFTGVAPTLAQYQSGGFDADLRCARPRV